MKSTSNLFLLIGIMIIISGCEKDESNNTTPEIDYEKTRVATSLKHTTTPTSDYQISTSYSYNGDDITVTESYNDGSGDYIYKYVKNGNKIDIEYVQNGGISHEGFYNLLPSGNIDTAYLYNLAGGVINNTAKYSYDSENRSTRQITYYNGYTNDIKIFYGQENASHWIYDRINYNTSTTAKDSVVFEYYSMPLRVPFRYQLERRYGVSDANLVKRRIYYDLQNNNEINKIYEYEYIVDSDGLVTQEIWKIVDQPSGTVSRTDTTTYTYKSL